MSIEKRGQVAAYEACLEDMWAVTDAIFDSLSPKGWARKHGADWRFADVPFHMAYFDNELIADALESGETLTPEHQIAYESFRQLNEWNAKHFASRLANHTLEASLADMRAVRDRLRTLLASMDDTDLGGKAWYRNAMFRGWRTKEWVIRALIGHQFDHIFEMRALLDTSAFRPAPQSVYEGLRCYAELFFTGIIHNNRAQLGDRTFVFASVFDGPGGGAWTHHCSQAGVRVSQGRAADAEFVIGMSAETLIAMGKGLIDPMAAIADGAIRVEGMEDFPTYGMLLALPDEDAHTLMAP